MNNNADLDQVQEREVVGLFPCPVQISQLPNARELNQDVMSHIKKIRAVTPNGRPEAWTAPVYTSLNTSDQIHLMPEFSALMSGINNEIINYSSTLGMDHENYPLRMKDCWFNIYKSRDGQEPHNHNNSFISGSYYVRAPQGSSGIRFHSPLYDNMFVPPLREKNQFNSTLVEVAVEEGMLVLFPSWLKHSVQPNTGKGERVSISFNVFM